MTGLKRGGVRVVSWRIAAQVAAVAGIAACGLKGPPDGWEAGDADDASGTRPADVATAGTGATSGGAGAGDPGHATGSTASGAGGAGNPTGSAVSTGSGSGPSTGSGGNGGGTGSGGSGGVGGDGCYSEGHDLTASIADVKSGYSESQWLASMLEVLDRRYHNGWFVLDAMKSDPWLLNDFPSYFDLSSWSGMAEALDTACHEESHGYDFDAALSTPGSHVYYFGANLQVTAPKLAFFGRDEILASIEAGGSVTAMYDETYLTGEQGSYDFIFLADELTAYTNGLACAVAVAGELPGPSSYRDGVAAHLYYLETYLKIARTQHASLYAQWKAAPEWQKFVRYAWARGNYWMKLAAPFSKLGIDDAPIWQRVNQPQNLAEIQQFTGDDAASVACTP